MRFDPNRVRASGPLARYVVGFAEELFKQGYRPERAARHAQLLTQLSRWLESQGLGEYDLSEERVAQFLEARRARGYAETPSLRWALKLLSFVPALEMEPAMPAAPSPLETVVVHFRRYLVNERGLSAPTVRGYSDMARLFLLRFEGPGGALDLLQVDAEAVSAFVVAERHRRSVSSAQVSVTALRSLLRFLFLEGYVTRRLGDAVPAVSVPKGFLPRGLADETVEALLGSRDISTRTGKRDLAVLTVLSRLGLRAGEVAGLRLDDLDWDHGELVVHGKGRRRERLPMPVDVGEALVAYLSSGRPRVECRAVFLRVHAPITAMTSSNVAEIVRRACKRAGVPKVGPHRLRHTPCPCWRRVATVPS
ncbi:MAG: tyrosine-type recombinase/integrase [Acidimicrobiales bacterium]